MSVVKHCARVNLHGRRGARDKWNDGMRGKHNQQVTCKAVRKLKLARCPGFVEPKQLIQIWVLVKSRMPEFVEPKQLVQALVLVKRARLTAGRSAARPNGKSKPPQSPLGKAVRYRTRGAARHSTQDHQGRGRGWSKQSASWWSTEGSSHTTV